MIEAWMPVIFAIVIVVGMVAVRAYKTLITEGLPLFREWLLEEQRDRLLGEDGALSEDLDLVRRVEELEEQVHFLESLLEEPRGPSTLAAGSSGAPAGQADAPDARPS